MSDYLIHGKKGNGKSLIAVGRMRDALLAGKPVATNLNLKIEMMVGAQNRTTRLFRLPDRPSSLDMYAIGRGSDNVDESTYGVIVLDEMATWMNARSFADHDRQKLLDWFVHSRKLGWDVYFICQNPAQIDKQVRESLVELSVACKRLDKLRIPFLGPLSKAILGKEIRAPKIHTATVRYGLGHNDLVNDRWTYRGTHLYACYDTQQVFKADYSDGLFCVLPAWHVYGRYLAPQVTWLQRMRSFFVAPPRPEFVSKAPSAVVTLLSKLPPEERIYHTRRLMAGGAL